MDGAAFFEYIHCIYPHRCLWRFDTYGVPRELCRLPEELRLPIARLVDTLRQVDCHPFRR
jgi:hypothetical protein